jgi:copper(I)-binding protein
LPAGAFSSDALENRFVVGETAPDAFGASPSGGPPPPRPGGSLGFARAAVSSASAHEGDDVIAGWAGSRRVGVGIALAASALLVLGGCAAGQDAQTAEETPVVDGVSANVGDIALRAVAVAAPPDKNYAQGSDATLQLVIVNGGATDDQLTGVTTPAAAEVRMFAAGSAASPGAASSPASTPTSPMPTSTPPTSSPETISEVNLPAGRAVPVGYSPDQPVIQLHNLTEQLFPAQTIELTFQFGSSGAVTFTAAVHLTEGPSTTPSVNVSPTQG